MPGQSFTTKPREGEWDSFLLQVERLGREAHSLQQQTISRSTKIADIATSGTMGAFLRKERRVNWWFFFHIHFLVIKKSFTRMKIFS